MTDKKLKTNNDETDYQALKETHKNNILWGRRARWAMIVLVIMQMWQVISHILTIIEK